MPKKLNSFEAAFQQYSRAVHADPSHQQDSLRLGRIYLLGGRIDDALEAAEKILERGQITSLLWVLRGNVRAREDDFDGAMGDWRAALELDPAATDATSLVSRLLMKADRLKEAESVLERGISKNPDDVTLRVVLAQLLLGRRDIEAAAEVADEIPVLEPQVLEHRARLAALYLGRLMRLIARRGCCVPTLNAIPIVPTPSLCCFHSLKRSEVMT